VWRGFWLLAWSIFARASVVRLRVRRRLAAEGEARREGAKREARGAARRSEKLERKAFIVVLSEVFETRDGEGCSAGGGW